MPRTNRSPRVARAHTVYERSEGVDPEQCYAEEPSGVQIHPQQHRDGEKPGDPSWEAYLPDLFRSLPPLEHNKPEQRKEPAYNVRTGVEMNGCGGLGQQHQHDRHRQTRATLQQLRKQQCENGGDEERAQPNHSIQSASLVENSKQNVIEPLPSKPRLTLHGGRKRIGARKSAGCENLLAGSDMPSDIGVSKWPIRQRPRQ